MRFHFPMIAQRTNDDPELPQRVNADTVLPTHAGTQRANNDLELPRVNTDSLLPTHHQPQRAYTLPPLGSYGPHLYHNETILSRTRDAKATAPDAKTWFAHIVTYAPVIGLVIAAIGIIVAIIAVVLK
jgi:hypothetical protein